MSWVNRNEEYIEEANVINIDADFEHERQAIYDWYLEHAKDYGTSKFIFTEVELDRMPVTYRRICWDYWNSKERG